MADPLSNEVSSPPDWERIDEAILCPLCTYNLRGLTQARCPECGFRFEWSEILNPSRRLHRYLFEHHPERNIWSFFRTLLGGLVPERFWRSLHPGQPSFRQRLMAYWWLVVGFYVLALMAQFGVLVLGAANTQIKYNRLSRQYEAPGLMNPATPTQKLAARFILQRYGSVENYFDAQYPLSITGVMVSWGAARVWSVGNYGQTVLLLLLGWPWLVLVGLLVFQISMRQARIRSIHVVRCIVYSFDTFVWLGMVLLLGTAAILVIGYPLGRLGGAAGLASLPELLVVVLLLIVSGVRLTAAYRRYLRFDHPYATVLAAHVMVILFLANAVVGVYLATGWPWIARLLLR
jgi:hypothetical protein